MRAMLGGIGTKWATLGQNGPCRLGYWLLVIGIWLMDIGLCKWLLVLQNHNITKKEKV